LWMVMLIIQSLPYTATVATAWISAQSYDRTTHDRVVVTPAAPVVSKAA